MKNIIAITLIIPVSCAITPAYAEGDTCVGTLLKDNKTLALNSSQTWAISQFIREHNDSTTSSSIGLSVPIYGVPASLNSSKAEKTARQFSEDTGISFDSKSSAEITESTLSDRAVLAYRICKEGELTDGVRVTAYDATPEKVSIRIRWVAGPLVPSEVPADLRYDPAEATLSPVAVNSSKTERTSHLANNFDGSSTETIITTITRRPGSQKDKAPSLPTRWKSGFDVTYDFDRVKGKPFTFTANIGGHTGRVHIPAIPEISVTPIHQEVVYPDPALPAPSRYIRLQNDGTGISRGPIENCLLAPKNLTMSSPFIETIIRAGNIDSTSYIKLLTAPDDENRVCYRAFLRPLSAEGGGDLTFRIHYVLDGYTFSVVK